MCLTYVDPNGKPKELRASVYLPPLVALALPRACPVRSCPAYALCGAGNGQWRTAENQATIMIASVRRSSEPPFRPASDPVSRCTNPACGAGISHHNSLSAQKLNTPSRSVAVH